ncbi:hypothetical protein AKJ16_DCAP07931 [Drosera capensis]
MDSTASMKGDTMIENRQPSVAWGFLIQVVQLYKVKRPWQKSLYHLEQIGKIYLRHEFYKHVKVSAIFNGMAMGRIRVGDYIP